MLGRELENFGADLVVANNFLKPDSRIAIDDSDPLGNTLGKDLVYSP